MGFNDPEAAKLKAKTRGIVGASMPSRRLGDPRQSRSAAPLMNDRMLGEGLRLDQDGKIALDFSLVSRASSLRLTDHTTVFNAGAGANVTDTNYTAAARLMFGSERHQRLVDLSSYTQVRLQINKRITAGVASSTLELKYGISYSATVGDFSQIGSEPVRVGIDTTQTLLVTDWIDLVPGSRADVVLALVTVGGNGATSPQYGYMGADFRR